MKKSFILMCLFCTFIYASLTAQVAQSPDCSSIEVSSLPSFPQDIFGQNVGFKRARDPNNYYDCAVIVTTYGAPANNNWKPRYFLEKKTGNTWFADGAASQVQSSRFNNLQLGVTYRIAIELPAYKLEQCNSSFGGKTPCFLAGTGEFIGFWGQWSGTLIRTNEITIGATQPSDNVSNFLDANGIKVFADANGNSSFFGSNEEVRINTAASKNYDRYFMAILEIPSNGSQGRWRALGNGGNGSWQMGQMPSVVSLTNDLWKIYNSSPWEFTPGNTYKLQIALSKDACSSWTEVISTFNICPANWACRAGGEKKADNKIVLSPNPASNKFRLDGVNFTDIKNCNVSISDISGREIQRFTDVVSSEFALNGLLNGVYIVNVTAGNRRLFSSKLVVNN